MDHDMQDQGAALQYFCPKPNEKDIVFFSRIFQDSDLVSADYDFNVL